MERPTCPLCKSQTTEKRFSERGYEVHRCHECGLLFIHPYPSDSDLVHNRVTQFQFDELTVTDPLKHYRSEQQYFRMYFPAIAQECDGAASFLDVGCGTGHLLEKLKMYPDLVRVGIELNTERAEFARKTAECDIHQIPIEKFESTTRFDVITLINVLSHIPSFDSLFTALRSLVSERGKVILKVGEHSDDARKGDIFDWYIPDHLHFLGLRTMQFVCDRYGFTIVRHRRIPFADELFSPEMWKSPGRSRVRNVVKYAVTSVPFALPLLSRVYRLTHGTRVYSSFIVLSRK